MKSATLLLTVIAALVLSSAAVAKEPTGATIEGPGLGGPLTIRGSADDGDGSALDRMVVAGGVGAAMFGHRIPDPMSRTQPPGELGPRYSVMYVVGGPDGTDYELAGEIYPYAKPRPLTYMEPGQPFFETFTTYGGWFVGGPKLKRALLDAGLPAQAPSEGDGPTLDPWLTALIAAAVVAGLALAAVSTLRRRKQRSPIAT